MSAGSGGDHGESSEGELSDASGASRASDPTASRIALGRRLRGLREASGISRDDAGHSIRASGTKISRMELGRVGLKERDVGDLLTLYGMQDAAERVALLELGHRSTQPGWWQAYGDVPTWFEDYLGLEQAASIIRTYEPQCVPGLLQTEDYARALMSMNYPVVGPEDVERRVRLRLHRQQLLTGSSPPKYWVVIDESVLRRPVGGPKVHLDQMRRLAELAELPNVTMQVVMFRSGGYTAAGGAFTVLRFAEPDLPDLVYLEQLTTALYVDKPAEVEFYTTMISSLAVQAEDPAATRQVLRAMIDE